MSKTILFKHLTFSGLHTSSWFCWKFQCYFKSANLTLKSLQIGLKREKRKLFSLIVTKDLIKYYRRWWVRFLFGWCAGLWSRDIRLEEDWKHENCKRFPWSFPCEYERCYWFLRLNQNSASKCVNPWYIIENKVIASVYLIEVLIFHVWLELAWSVYVCLIKIFEHKTKNSLVFKLSYLNMY